MLLAIDEQNISEIQVLSQVNAKNNISTVIKGFLNLSSIFQYLEKIDLPKIILVITIGLICSIFIIKNQLSYIKKSTLIALLGIIIMNLSLELILLFSPKSPFKIIDYSSFKSKKSEVILNSKKQNKENSQLDQEGLSLHPTSQYRIATLILVDGATQIGGRKIWNLAGSEFLIGTDPNADLTLPIISEDKLAMRISQRSGTFFLESLSKDLIVRIEQRQMNRYQEYEIPNFIKFSIDRFYFSLEIK